MPLSPEVVQALIDALNAKIGHVRPCPVCGQSDFAISDGVFTAVIEDSTQPSGGYAVSPFGGATYGGPGIMGRLVPQRIASHVMLYCLTCGNTYFLNVNVLGVWELLSGIKAPQNG